jgi:uncharacterized membrane protein YkoI
MISTAALRRAHRYLGVVIGIQFLGWTVGGLYFSWMSLDTVHADPQKAPPPALRISPGATLISPARVIENMASLAGFQEVRSVELLPLLDQPIYRVTFLDQRGEIQFKLADASTGLLRPEISEEEAKRIARAAYAGTNGVKSIARIESTSGHHEYRRQPLPAWQVGFDDATGTRLYVHAGSGAVRAFRNTPWRIFDFLWMLHTMDYSGRDNFNNLLLRAFSVFGLATIGSGFALFFATAKWRGRSLRGRGEG